MHLEFHKLHHSQDQKDFASTIFTFCFGSVCESSDYKQKSSIVFVTELMRFRQEGSEYLKKIIVTTNVFTCQNFTGFTDENEKDYPGKFIFFARS